MKNKERNATNNQAQRHAAHTDPLASFATDPRISYLCGRVEEIIRSYAERTGLPQPSVAYRLGKFLTATSQRSAARLLDGMSVLPGEASNGSSPGLAVDHGSRRVVPEEKVRAFQQRVPCPWPRCEEKPKNWFQHVRMFHLKMRPQDKMTEDHRATIEKLRKKVESAHADAK